LVNYPGCTWVPDPPQDRGCSTHLDASPAAVSAASQELGERGELIPPRWVRTSSSPRAAMSKITVSEHLDEVTDGENR